MQDTQRACFPLSLAHYMETYKHGNPRRRSRLGRLMLRISKGVTIASPKAILRHELDVALSKRFPGRVRVQPFELPGYGISHMDPRIRFHLSWPDVGHLDPRKKEAFERLVNCLMEKALVSGVMPVTGESAPKVDLSRPDLQFKEHLEEWAVTCDLRVTKVSHKW